MTDKQKRKYLKPWSPATYRIEVEGPLNESWADGFVGMIITTRKRPDKSIITCLNGRVMDQSHLMGMLDALAELHLPILSVENRDEK